MNQAKVLLLISACVFFVGQVQAEDHGGRSTPRVNRPVAPTSSATEKLAAYMNADPNRVAWRNRWGKSAPNLSAAQLALSYAVLATGAKSVTGTMDPGICRESDAYAQSDANARKQQGHAGFGARAGRIGGRGASEIEAESWPYPFAQPDELMKHAKNCVDSWMHSPGHRADMMKPHQRFCYSMAIGKNGTAYCIGLFAD